MSNQRDEGSAPMTCSGLPGCRAAFEKWASSPLKCFSLRRRDDGEYADVATGLAWTAWRAARELSEWDMICAVCDSEGKSLASDEIAIREKMIDAMAKEIADREGHGDWESVMERHTDAAQPVPHPHLYE